MKRDRLREVYACRKCHEYPDDGVDAIRRNHPGPTLPLHLRGRDRHGTSRCLGLTGQSANRPIEKACVRGDKKMTAPSPGSRGCRWWTRHDRRIVVIGRSLGYFNSEIGTTSSFVGINMEPGW